MRGSSLALNVVLALHKGKDPSHAQAGDFSAGTDLASSILLCRVLLSDKFSFSLSS